MDHLRRDWNRRLLELVVCDARKFHCELSSGQSSRMVLPMPSGACALLCHTCSLHAQRGLASPAWYTLLWRQAGGAQRLGARLERHNSSLACYNNCFEDLERCNYDRSSWRRLRIYADVLVSCNYLCEGTIPSAASCDPRFCACMFDFLWTLRQCICSCQCIPDDPLDVQYLRVAHFYASPKASRAMNGEASFG